MTYFTNAVAQIVADQALSSDGKAQKLNVVKSQVTDLLRAAGLAEVSEREQDLEEIDQALAIIFSSQQGAPNAD